MNLRAVGWFVTVVSGRGTILQFRGGAVTWVWERLCTLGLRAYLTRKQIRVEGKAYRETVGSAGSSRVMRYGGRDCKIPAKR